MLWKKILILVFLLGIYFPVQTDAQSRLVPTCRYAGSQSDDLKQYREKLDSLLLNDLIDIDFAYVVDPSFFGEYSCRFDRSKSEFVLKVAKRNIWFYYFGSNSQYEAGKSPEVEIVEYRCAVPFKTAMCFKDLFFTSIFSSSYLATRSGLDGVTYELLFEGGWQTAEFWSPKEGTNCYKLEDILVKLTDAVKENNPDEIENLLPQVKDLTNEFKKLLPEEIKEVDFWIPSYTIKL